MPKRVRRMQQSPVIAPASRCECVEGRRHHRGPPRDGVPAEASEAGGTPSRKEGFGGAGGPNAGDDHTGTEAHAIDVDIDQSRLAPVALNDLLRVRGVEALDASSKEGADARPLLRDRAANEGQSDRGVRAPQGSKDRIGRHSEIKCNDSPSWPHDSGELAQSRGGIVDVAQEVREGQVVEGFIWERQRLGASADERDVSIARGGGSKHVSTSVEADNLAAIPLGDRARDQTGPSRHIEYRIVRSSVEQRDEPLSPTRVLPKRKECSGALVRSSDPAKDAARVVRSSGGPRPLRHAPRGADRRRVRCASPTDTGPRTRCRPDSPVRG